MNASSRYEVYIVMELCGGELFDEIVKRAKRVRADALLPPCFDEATAVSTVRSLPEAVAHLHKQDTVPRH